MFAAMVPLFWSVFFFLLYKLIHMSLVPLQVNQTVDSMVEERALLQKQVQQLQLEVDSHGRARRQLEHENAHLLERVSGFEQQQVY